MNKENSLTTRSARAAFLALAIAATLSSCEAKRDEAPPASETPSAPSATAPKAAEPTTTAGEASIASTFRGWGRARQLEYFRSLAPEERFLFLRDFLPDASLKVDADTVVTFRAGGSFELIRGMGTEAQAHSGGNWTAGAGRMRIDPAADGLWPSAPFTALRVEATLDGAFDGGLRFVLGSLTAAEAKVAADMARAEAMKAAREGRMPPRKMPIPGGMYEGADEDAPKVGSGAALKEERLNLDLTELTID